MVSKPQAPLGRGLVSVLTVAAALASVTPAAATASPAVAAAPSLHVSGVTRIASTSVYNGADFKQTTASCPVGKVLTGTGYYVYGANTAISMSRVQANGSETVAPTAVTAAAYERNPSASPGNWSVTAHAICADASVGSITIAGGSPYNATNVKTATAVCPTGKVLSGSGFLFPQFEAIPNYSHGVVVDDLRPQLSSTPNRTALTAYEAAPATHVGNWQVQAQAICVNPLAGLVRVARTTNFDGVHTKTFTAPCPPANTPVFSEYALIGSGYEVSGGIGRVDTRRMSPNGSTTVVPNQVMITGHEQPGFTGNWSVTAYAICALQYPVISP